MLQKKHEKEKRRCYEQRVREVEKGSFSPVVLSATGGMGRTAQVTFKRLASLLTAKRDEPYSHTIAWIRCLISFSLLRSAIMCLRGARSYHNHPIKNRISNIPLDLAITEGRVPVFLTLKFISLFFLIFNLFPTLKK